MVEGSQLGDDPLWYKDAVIYEVRLRSFFDSNDDGIGDLRGLVAKLDYVQSLGVTALWLLPFYPSPLRDDGYDISDYTNVSPDCGTLADFKALVRQAHARGIRIITELVLNHTSDRHPWFQRARRAPPGSSHRDFYVWSDTSDRYREARIIFRDFERSNWTWDPVAKAHYWHRFYSHQPDLNFDNPEVRRALFKVVDFWLRLGVDGLRLDAVPYLFEREGTSCENLPETHAFLRELRRHVDKHHVNRMLLAEANQWPEDAAAYLADGRECHMAFHFPVMPRLFLALHKEDRFPISDILTQTPPLAETCQWALFLRNHDELTLEMVTDEERDFMVEVFATDPATRLNLGIRRRLAPLLGNNRRKMELMTALLFSLPGTPVVYYGDELGMGDNVYLGDRNGVRTPMQWSADRNAGFSRANPQRLILPIIIDPEYHYEAQNVDAQERNPSSLLWWTRRIIAMRKRFKAFGRGSLEMLHPDNPAILAFVRELSSERVLVVANLSRFVQAVELDLARYRDQIPLEVFGRVRFPPIGEGRYFLSLGPHSFYWFSLEQRAAPTPAARPDSPAIPTLTVERPWSRRELVNGDFALALSPLLPGYLTRAQWLGDEATKIRTATIDDVLPVENGDEADVRGSLVVVQVEHFDSTRDRYLLPVSPVFGPAAAEIARASPWAILANLEGPMGAGVLCEGTADPRFCRALPGLWRRPLHGSVGQLVPVRSGHLPEVELEQAMTSPPRALGTEQSSNSLVLGEALVFKLIRLLEYGPSPAVELGRFLSEQAHFAHAPELLGWLEYHARAETGCVAAVAHRFVPNQGDAWQYTRQELKRFFEQVLAAGALGAGPEVPARPVTELGQELPPPGVAVLIGGYLRTARILGRRTAEMHLALLASTDEPDLAPEPFTAMDQRSLYQSLRNLAVLTLRRLRARLGDVPEASRAAAAGLLEAQEKLVGRFRELLGRRLSVVRMRHHGDFQLGQLLYTGRDFIIVDFEGQALRPLAERRRKKAALTDVAWMLRSIDYAAQSTLLGEAASGGVSPANLPLLKQWAVTWERWVAAAFVDAYREIAAGSLLVPPARPEFQCLLDVFVLEKALLELGHELDHRPQWLGIPLGAIDRVLGVDRGK